MPMIIAQKAMKSHLRSRFIFLALFVKVRLPEKELLRHQTIAWRALANSVRSGFP